MFNSITVFADKISGEVATSAKGNKYLKGGQLTIDNKGTKETVRVSWMGLDESMLNQGVTVRLELEASERDGKSYTGLIVREAVPAFSSENSGYLTGTVLSFKEFNKLLSVDLQIETTSWNGTVAKGVQQIKILDKTSAMGETLKAAKGSQVLVKVELSPNKGFTEFTVKHVSPVGGSIEGQGAQLEAAAPKVEEELPF